MISAHSSHRSSLTLLFASAIVSLFLVAACKNSEPPPHKAVLDMKHLMSWVIDPAAVALWASVGSVVTKDGVEKIAPQSDEDWATARNNAALVAEAGNLLMLEGRAVDRDAWMLAARGLIDKAEIAMKAAANKDPEALFTANSDLFLACTECHKTYLVAGQSTLGDAAPAKK